VDIAVLNRTQVLEKIQHRLVTVEAAGMPVAETLLGDVFLHLAEQLDWYTVYCTNQPLALSTVKQLALTNQEFADYCNTLMADPTGVCRGLSLARFIIRPLQRLRKYPTFLRELINNTEPNTMECQKLQEAMQKMNETIEYLTNTARSVGEKTAEKMKSITELEKLIYGCDKLELASDPNRNLVLQSPILKYDTKKKEVNSSPYFSFQ